MAQRTQNKRRSRRSNNDEGALRKRSRYLDDVKVIDINDHEFLRKFVTEYGKIIPARLTGASAKQQRQIKQGIRRARNMGLIL
ncbi:MAG: 30S ribosomal protein S18 [Kiritimatiellae bacterium]|nr:30S ribosomal protein S18 [Kiritimatiellia bacterium]